MVNLSKLASFVLLSSLSVQVSAHTNSIGYTSDGGGAATFWYGTWHPGTTYNEGSIQLLGISGVTYNQTQLFSLLNTSTPSGLVSGENYFTSNGSQLVAYGSNSQVSYAWQGATFTGLTAGTYQFTYIPIQNPTATWDPMDPIILSSTITLTDLFLNSGGSLIDLNPNAYALRGAFNLQSAIVNTGLNYDCTTFDVKGICVSAGGRVTDTNNPSTNSQGALLIASYRANEHVRIGGYLDQNLSSKDARGVNLDNNNPMVGMFGVWNQNTDGTGYEVRVAAGYSDKDVTVTRSSGLNTEAGKGDSSLQSTAVSATVSRGFALKDTRWIASPYLGLRYTKLQRNGYTEDLSADVQNPLTYSGLSQETTTALVGLRLNARVGDKINLMASAGVENDINHNVGDYSAIGIDSLSFNQNIRHVRPVASAGASYAIDKRHVVGVNMNYRQEAFNSSNSVSGMVTYQVGF